MIPFALALVLAPAPVQDVSARTSTEGRLEPEVRLYERARRVARPARAHDAGPASASASFLTVNQDPEGDLAREVAFRADGTEALVVNRDTDLVSFFDVSAVAITHTVDVGDFPVDVAVAPDDSYAVVPNVFGDSVSVIDLGTHTVAATVPITGSQPYRVAITSDSALAVVGVINDAITSSISVIDLATMQEVRTFATVPQGVVGFWGNTENGASGVTFSNFALSPDDTTLLVPDVGGDQLAIYDITTGAQVALLATDDAPFDVDISADGTRAVLADDGNGASIEVVDLTVPAITHSFVTGSVTFGPVVRITPDKTHAILAVSNAVEFVNLTTGAVAATVSTGTVGDIEISFDGQYALVSNFNFRIIDIATRSLVKTIPFAPCVPLAVSPVAHRAVALNTWFREDVHLYSTDGASGAFLGSVPSGVPEEGDAPRTVAVTADGARAVVVNNLSDNVAVVDLATSSVAGYIPTGRRSLGVAVSPDGTTAVVCNADEHTASILDLTTMTEVASLSVPSSPAVAAISPDGSQAFVASIAGTDRLYFIDLNGASSVVTGSLPTGQMGVIYMTYGVFSGMTVSPDGATLALCISFDDELLLIDTATKTIADRVTVGDFPIRATFSPDSKHVYVTHSFGDSLVEVSDNGSGFWSVTGTAGGIDFPLHVTLDEAGDYAYVGSWNTSPRMAVVDTATMASVAQVGLPSSPRSQERTGNSLLVSLTGGELARLRMAGPATAVLETASLVGGPSDMAFSEAFGTAVACEPGALDGVDLVRFGGDAATYCSPAVPNSTGQPAEIAAHGTFLAGGSPLDLVASHLPHNQFGYFLVSDTQGFVANPGGSQGNLCLAGTIGRFVHQLQNSGSAGVITIAVDTTALPFSPPLAVQPGETWNFQGWYRDKNPTTTSNFTDGVSVTFD